MAEIPRCDGGFRDSDASLALRFHFVMKSIARKTVSAAMCISVLA